MTQFYRYRSAYGATAWSVDLGNDAVRLGALEGLTEMAEHCQVGTSSIVIDDPDADVGHSSDAILGHQRFEMDETDMASGNRRVFTALIGERGYRRGDSERKSLRVSAARQIEVQLFDLNVLCGLRIIPQTDTDAKRPAETVAARLSWILGSDYLTGLVADNGLVADASAFGCDAVDYRGSRAVNVIGDCELASGWFAFVYPDETQAVIGSLFFDDANTSTAYSSTLRISNVLSDIDTKTSSTFTTGTTFGPLYDGELKRSPVELGSGVYLPYARGARYRTRAATAAIYGSRDIVAPNANVKTASKADDIADAFLWDHHTEDDRIEVEVEVPTSKVNSIRAGHRIQVKFSHLPGYESFTWCRVMQRTIVQGEATDRYVLKLVLSPQEEGPPEGAILQRAFANGGGGGAYPTFPNPVTIGSKLVFMVVDRDGNGNDPNTAVVSEPTWGAGAWTEISLQDVDATGDPDTIRAFYKTADSTNQECWIDASFINVFCWELPSNADVAGATVLDVELLTATPYTVGTIGDTDAADVMLMGVAVYDEPSSARARSYPDGWTEQYASPSYVTFYTHHPWAYFADATGEHTGLVAQVSTGVSKRYAGIALKVTLT